LGGIRFDRTERDGGTGVGRVGLGGIRFDRTERDGGTGVGRVGLGGIRFDRTERDDGGGFGRTEVGSGQGHVSLRSTSKDPWPAAGARACPDTDVPGQVLTRGTPPRTRGLPASEPGLGAGAHDPTGTIAGMTRVAAVDCGTNSVRLLVADLEPAGAGLSGGLRRMEITRLGQGVDATGRLAPQALERTGAVLREYAGEIRRLGAGPVRVAATSATRDAANRSEFVELVRGLLGVEPEVITGREE